MITPILFAKIFVIILSLKLAIAIGLNWSTESALETLGISTTEFAFQLGKRRPDLKDSETALQTFV